MSADPPSIAAAAFAASQHVAELRRAADDIDVLARALERSPSMGLAPLVAAWAEDLRRIADLVEQATGPVMQDRQLPS